MQGPQNQPALDRNPDQASRSDAVASGGIEAPLRQSCDFARQPAAPKDAPVPWSAKDRSLGLSIRAGDNAAARPQGSCHSWIWYFSSLNVAGRMYQAQLSVVEMPDSESPIEPTATLRAADAPPLKNVSTISPKSRIPTLSIEQTIQTGATAKGDPKNVLGVRVK